MGSGAAIARGGTTIGLVAFAELWNLGGRRRAARVSMSWVWCFVVDGRVVGLAPAVARAHGLTLRKVLLRDAVELTGDVGPPQTSGDVGPSTSLDGVA